MVGWLEDVAGPGFASAVLWTFLALVLLVMILIIIRLVRSLTFGTYVVGGKNRKTRLAIMDAAAVDSHRRLVLVRRDDIEHLILIGGPTDVVVEQHIRAGVPAGNRRPDGAPEQVQQPQVQQQRPRPPSPPPSAAQQQPPVRAPEPRRAPPPPPPAPAPVQARQPERTVTPPPPPARAPSYEAKPQPARTPPPPPPRKAATAPSSAAMDDLDKALLSELEVSLDSSPAPSSRQAPAPQQPPKKKPELSLEDEMNKLLGELTAKKK